MLTCVIPVKTKSERLEAKNLQQFIDCPLYEHKFRQIKNVPFDRIVVSSESKEVLKVAEKYKFQTHLRDPKYSTPEIPMSEVYRYIASEVSGDDIAWVNVNNPLVTAIHYRTVLNYWKRYKTFYDCLLSVYNEQKYLWYLGKPVNFTPYPHPKSQDLKGVFAESFAINIRPRKDVIKEGTFEGKHPYFYQIDKYISTKIDYQEDLEFCRLLARRYL